MKLRLLAVASLLAMAGSAMAAPTLQSCAPMEITHKGVSGLSYSLSCSAGEWQLLYTGAVPGGTDIVNAQYKVAVAGPGGASFSQNRVVRIAAPAQLGQALVREAVLLDNGDLALRECAEIGCTLYRPLGAGGEKGKATVTVTPEIKRLVDERKQLTDTLAQRTSELNAQTQEVARLTLELTKLQSALQGTQKALSDAKSLAPVKVVETIEVPVKQACPSDDQVKVEGLAKARDLAQQKVGALADQIVALNAKLEAQAKDYQAELQRLESVNKGLFAALSEARDELYAAKQAARSADANAYIITDLVAQHDNQLQALRQALPDSNLEGLVGPLKVPTITASAEGAKQVLTAKRPPLKLKQVQPSKKPAVSSSSSAGGAEHPLPPPPLKNK